jgi:hypothetical protein
MSSSATFFSSRNGYKCQFIWSIARVLIGSVLFNLFVISVARIRSRHKGPRHHWSDHWEGKDI